MFLTTNATFPFTANSTFGQWSLKRWWGFPEVTCDIGRGRALSLIGDHADLVVQRIFQAFDEVIVHLFLQTRILSSLK